MSYGLEMNQNCFSSLILTHLILTPLALLCSGAYFFHTVNNAALKAFETWE